MNPENNQVPDQNNPNEQKPVVYTEQPEPTQGGAPVSPQEPKRNYAKTFSKVKIVYQSISLVILMIFVYFLFDYVYKKSHSGKILLFMAGFEAFLLLMLVLQYVSYRQLKKSADVNPQFNQFQTGTAITYVNPKGAVAAQASEGEKVINWMGPVGRTDKGGFGYEILSKEVDRQGENTLLFTDKQIIFLMLGPQDASTVAGSVNGAASVAEKLIEISPEAGTQKGVQFEALYAAKWPDMVNVLVAQPIQNILSNHLNFGLPYPQIDHIEVKKKFVNPGLRIHLKDGSKISYSTFKQDRLDSIAESLKPYVALQ